MYMTPAQEALLFVGKLQQFVLFPLIALITSIAFLVLLWGLAEYMMNSENAQAREKGVRHITYGIIGMVVMASAFAILLIASATFGLDTTLQNCSNLTGAGCGFTLPPPPPS